MRHTLITQIALILVGSIIIFAFIKPMFAEIKTTQDEMSRYSEAVSKASQFNSRLRELISIRDSFPQSGMSSLEQFIPTSVDVLILMKNIENIFAVENIEITSLTAKEASIPQVDVNFENPMGIDDGVNVSRNGVSDTVLSQQDFEVTFSGTYIDLKNVLLLLEKNATLLEVVELEFSETAQSDSSNNGSQASGADNGKYTFSLILRSYGLTQSQSQSQSRSPESSF